MKHYVLNPTKNHTARFKTWYDYLIDLDNQVWSLYDYLTFINPNYLVFNESDTEVADGGVYYSNRELEQLHLIQPVYFNISGKYEKGIIIFPGQLPFHRGIVNNFSEYNKDYTLLCWFGYEDVFGSESGWGEFGAEFHTSAIVDDGEVLVPANSWVINYNEFIDKGKLMKGFGFTDADNNVYKILTTSKLRLLDVDATPNASGEYSTSDVVGLSTGQLRLISGRDIIWSSEGLLFEPEAVENAEVSPIMIFPEAYTVLSLIAPSRGLDNNQNPEKQNPNNFFLGSLSASAAVYRITSSIYAGTTYHSTWRYYPPDDSTGSDLLFNFISPRSYLKTNLTSWNALTGSTSSFQQISTNVEGDTRLIYIGNGLSVNGTPVSQIWTQFDPIGSEFVHMTTGLSNDVMIEPIEVEQEVQKTSTTNLAGEGVAMYTINVKNYKASLFNNIKWFLW